MCSVEGIRHSWIPSSCSNSKKDVPVGSLAHLLEAEYFGAASWSGKDKLARAVNSSTAVVAAFARTEDLNKIRAGGW